jgi:hypothetical protein
LRVGNIPVKTIYENGHKLRISKFRTSNLFAIPIILGDGLTYAERRIKAQDYEQKKEHAADLELDLSGMQCRWDKIKPPLNSDEVVSLLVTAVKVEDQAMVFQKVIKALDNIYGNAERRQPISIPRLKLKATLQKIGLEMRARIGGYRPLYLFRTWVTTKLGTLYFRTKPGKNYLQRLVEMSDTLVIDGRINTVISGTEQQRKLLQVELDSLEQNGELHYGLFVSQESVMSCYVRNMNDTHVHFVDGSGGGYTKAAGVLKAKRKDYNIQ